MNIEHDSAEEAVCIELGRVRVTADSGRWAVRTLILYYVRSVAGDDCGASLKTV